MGALQRTLGKSDSEVLEVLLGELVLLLLFLVVAGIAREAKVTMWHELTMDARWWG